MINLSTPKEDIVMPKKVSTVETSGKFSIKIKVHCRTWITDVKNNTVLKNIFFAYLNTLAEPEYAACPDASEDIFAG